MRFDINQKEFPSTTQKSIWHSAVFMAPFREVITPGVTGAEIDDLRKGEKNLYQFMTDFYSDLYENPEAYYLPVGEYDNFMRSRDRKNLTDKDKLKESLLRNKFQRAIQFYQKLLFEIGSKAELDNRAHNLTMAASILSDMMIKHNFRILQGEQEKRAKALSNVGMEIGLSQSKITVSNDRYPGMLAALLALCKANTGKFALTNFLRCDFRGVMDSFKPSFDDAVSILPDDFRKMASEMDDFMRSIRCRISAQPLKNTTLFSQWKVGYSLKGKSVYSFHSDTDTLETFVCFSHYQNVSRMGYLLKEESDSLRSWFDAKIPIRLCACRYNRPVDIGGHRKRICGLMNKMDVINPDRNDLQNLKHIVEIYLEKIRI